MKIRQKFIITLLLIGLIPMLVVGISAYGSASNSLLAKTTDQLNSVAIKQTQRIATILQNQQEEVTKLANQYDLHVRLGNYIARPTDANRAPLDTILQNRIIDADAPSMQYIRLANFQGETIATSSSREDVEGIGDVSEPRDGNATSVRVIRDTRDGLTKLQITTVVTVNKEKAALLIVIFRTDDIVATVQDYTGLDETGETLVVVNEGNPRVALFPLRFDTDAALSTDVSMLDISNAAPGVYRTGTDYRGHQVLYVAHPIGLTDWTAIVKIDRDEALAPTFALRDSIVWMLVVACLIILGTALFFTRLFTRPILHIANVARRIGAGDFSTSVALRRKDEIGALGLSIDTMKNNLNQLVSRIESQRERLEVILNTTTEGIFAIDKQGIVLLANRAIENLLRTNPEELVGKDIRDIFQWSREGHPATVEYILPDVHTYTDLEYNDLKDERRYAKLIVAPVNDPTRAGRTYAIVTIHDETSSHELENMKADFVSMAAHELRTPLTAVRGYLEMASFKQQNNEKDVATYIDKALDDVNELGGLINNLLDITRIERGTLSLQMNKVDLAECVSQAIENSRFDANEHRLDLSYHGPARGSYVVGDIIALREIITNLLSNAIKYTRPGGSVVVSLEKQDGYYKVHVKDTGVGIAEDAQKHLFSKFYRVHGGLDSGSTGTGLGLYISKSIAERHQGTITVESKENEGSTFTFAIPEFSEESLQAMSRDGDDQPTTVRRKRGWVTKNIAR